MLYRRVPPLLGAIFVLAVFLVMAAAAGYAQTATSNPAPGPVAGAAAGSPHLTGDPFTVRDVKVDVTAASAAAARDQAIAQGQRQAFQEIFRRLTGSGQPVPNIGNADLDRLVQGFEIDDERASAVRYLATLSFKFRPQATRQYLLNAGVPFTDVPSKPTLILPVYEAGSAPVLWEDRTPWRDSWENYSAPGALVPVVVSPGDLADVANIGVKEALEGASGPLSTIAGRYGAGEVVVARLVASSANGVQVLYSRHRLDGGQPETDQFALSANPGESQQALMNRAVAGVVERLETAYRTGRTIQGGAENRLTVTVPIIQLSDWLETRRRLSQVPTITRAELKSLSLNTAEIMLTFHGAPEQLRVVLAQRALSLVPAVPAAPVSGMPPVAGSAPAWELRLDPPPAAALGNVPDTAPPAAPTPLAPPAGLAPHTTVPTGMPAGTRAGRPAM